MSWWTTTKPEGFTALCQDKSKDMVQKGPVYYWPTSTDKFPEQRKPKVKSYADEQEGGVTI